jgi:hypothetical protein
LWTYVVDSKYEAVKVNGGRRREDQRREEGGRQRGRREW